MKSGIYCICNRKNGKFYIGSARNILHRWKHGHIRNLKRNRHSNKHLQNAWNKYGEDCFALEVLEYQPNHLLESVEQEYLDMWVTSKLCYNIATSAKAPFSGRKMSLEHKLKFAYYSLGKIRSKEHCENLSKSLAGKSIPINVRKKISQSLLGKVESDATKQKKSLFWQGKTNNPHAHLTEQDVLEIRSEFDQNKTNRHYKMALSKKYDVSWNTIHRIVNRHNWNHI